MRSFYADILCLHRMQPESDTAIWFRDLGTEIQVEAVASKDNVVVHGPLLLYFDDVERAAKTLQSRGADVQLRPTSTGPEAVLKDPDGNIIMIVPRSNKA